MSLNKTRHFTAFTYRFNGVARQLITHVGLLAAQPPPGIAHPPPNVYQTQALWDTGATHSLITTNTATQLGLIPIRAVQMSHAGGVGSTNVYLVDLYLPNGVHVNAAEVNECPPTVGNFGAIIGMDIITTGDFSITHANGATVMSFRYPSIQDVDYVKEADRIRFAGAQRNDPCPCGKKDSNGRPVRFKHCHGAA